MHLSTHVCVIHSDMTRVNLILRCRQPAMMAIPAPARPPWHKASHLSLQLNNCTAPHVPQIHLQPHQHVSLQARRLAAYACTHTHMLHTKQLVDTCSTQHYSPNRHYRHCQLTASWKQKRLQPAIDMSPLPAAPAAVRPWGGR
jgi:hypothetical protein